MSTEPSSEDTIRDREANEEDSQPGFGVTFERNVGLAGRFAQCVDAKGQYYPSHSQGVEKIARAIAEAMNLDPAQASRIATAGLLHDVGKLLTPDRILLKADKLTPAQAALMRSHPVDGERILVAAGYGDEALWVRHHHAHWDGTGYPDPLKGADIPLEAAIVGVADAFHAMQSDRPYSRAHSTHWALAELKSQAGYQFSPQVVACVIEMDFR